MDKICKAEFDALLKMPFDLEIMGRLYYQARELLLGYGFNVFKPKTEERDKFISILLDVIIKIVKALRRKHIRGHKNSLNGFNDPPTPNNLTLDINLLHD